MSFPKTLFLFMLLALTGCQSSPTSTTRSIFSTDFNSDESLQTLDRVTHGENLTIVRDPMDGANNVLRINVADGGHYGGSFHVDLKEHMEREPSHLYIRYRIWLDANWQPESSGKLPGFNGTYSRAGWGGRPSDGTNGWSARGMFGRINADGRIPIGSYIYHADMTERNQQYGNSELWNVTLERERWYMIEQEIQLDAVQNHVGQANGWIRAWVDGELVFDRAQLHVRDTEDLRIESVWGNVYYGGKTPAPADMSLLIDDLFVATTRPRNASG